MQEKLILTNYPLIYSSKGWKGIGAIYGDGDLKYDNNTDRTLFNIVSSKDYSVHSLSLKLFRFNNSELMFSGTLEECINKFKSYGLKGPFYGERKMVKRFGITGFRSELYGESSFIGKVGPGSFLRFKTGLGIKGAGGSASCDKGIILSEGSDWSINIGQGIGISGNYGKVDNSHGISVTGYYGHSIVCSGFGISDDNGISEGDDFCALSSGFGGVLIFKDVQNNIMSFKIGNNIKPHTLYCLSENKKLEEYKVGMHNFLYDNTNTLTGEEIYDIVKNNNGDLVNNFKKKLIQNLKKTKYKNSKNINKVLNFCI
jgi:hypothetical protein